MCKRLSLPLMLADGGNGRARNTAAGRTIRVSNDCNGSTLTWRFLKIPPYAAQLP
jgi:hypothetical protein